MARVPAHHAARLRAQQLSGPPASSAVEVAERLLAVQAQDPRGFRLAVRSRTSGLTAQDVDRDLEERRLVVSWLNRGTLHLVTAEDYWWLHPLTAPQLRTTNATRLRQEGVDPEQAARGVDVVTRVLTEGPATRAALRAHLDAAGVPTARQALVHIVMAATLQGLAVRGPVIDSEQAFVAPELWLGPRPADLDRDEALAQLALRYLRGHGPAAPTDLARWAGLPLGQARRGFAAVADRTAALPAGELVDAVDLVERVERAERVDGHRRAPGLPPPRLLGAFDPLLLGWTSRADTVGSYTGLVTNNGMFRPFALVGGRAVGTWNLAGTGAARQVQVRHLEDLSAAKAAALEADGRDVLRFLEGH